MRVSLADRRQQLIDAAIRLMWRKGVEHTTIRDIAREAEAPLASVHYCFDSKDDLMQAAVEYWLAELLERQVDEVKVNAGLRVTMERIAYDFWASLVRNPVNILAQLEVDLWAIRSSSSPQLARMIFQRYGEEFGRVFAEAMDAADETCDIEPPLLARALFGVIDGASLQYLGDPESDTPKELLDLLLESLFDRIRIRPRTLSRS